MPTVLVLKCFQILANFKNLGIQGSISLKVLRPATNFCASKKLLKSWAEGVKVGCRGARLFMKSNPDLNCNIFRNALRFPCLFNCRSAPAPLT